MPDVDVVTGAFGYTGRYITGRLLESIRNVKTLTGHPNRPNQYPSATSASTSRVRFREPLEQPADCSFGGGDLVVTFEDGSELRYGPCRRPASIKQLWAGMVYVIDDGECSPRRGPGGAFRPFQYVIHVPRPEGIGQPDWGNSIIESAREKACPTDLDKDGSSWGGRGFGASDEGMVVRVDMTTARVTS